MAEKKQFILRRVKDELGKVVVGQETLIEEVVICLFAEGHLLLRGLPGLAKTTVIRALARAFGVDFKRVQFTPDLMPNDLIGYEILEENRGKRMMKFVQGPIFTQFLLADEINRTPPKTQSALLQSMSEGEVAVMGKSVPIGKPFLVMATQNPIEQEGTYPLPEAQLDRFMFLVNATYPSVDEEAKIATLDSEKNLLSLRQVLSSSELLRHIEQCKNITIAEPVIRWIVRIVQASRPQSDVSIPEVKQYVHYGASPRASQYIVHASRAYAYLENKKAVERHHIEQVAYPVLRHRIQMNFNAEADGMSSDRLIALLLKLKL